MGIAFQFSIRYLFLQRIMLFLLLLSRPPDKSATGKSIFLLLNQNICCGYSKEQSQ